MTGSLLRATPHHLDGIGDRWWCRLPKRSRKRHHSRSKDMRQGEREEVGEGRDLTPVPPLMYIASAERTGRPGRHGMFPLPLREEKGEWPVYQSDSRVAKRFYELRGSAPEEGGLTLRHRSSTSSSSSIHQQFSNLVIQIRPRRAV